MSNKGKKINLKNAKLIAVLVIALLGSVVVLNLFASTPWTSLEPEDGNLSDLQPLNDASASNDSYIQFGSNVQVSENAGVFITRAELERAKNRNGAPAPFGSSYSLQTSLANGDLAKTPDVFYMNNSSYLNDIKYEWCSTDNNPNNSLKDATGKLDNDSSFSRRLAMQYALTGDTRYADKSLEFLKAWAQNSTVINMYDFYTDTTTFGQLRGMTDSFCSERPWNFALDGMWQGYGLINFSDSYVLLKNNGYQLSTSDDAIVKDYIKRLTEAINSSYHAWTRWADAHPNSSAYTRYRADNHLSWAHAMLMSASVALNDQSLAEYCINGGSWNDSRAGNYQNPSPIKSLIDKAILSDGRIIDPVEFGRPETYTFFHLWPLQLSSIIAERHYGEDLWNYKGSDGAGLEKGYLAAVNTVVSGGYSNESWQYEIPYNKWRHSSLKSARDRTDRQILLKQSIGPIALLYGEE